MHYTLIYILKFCFEMFHTILTECFLKDLQHSLSNTSDDEASPMGTSRDPLLASSNWSTRHSLFSEDRETPSGEHHCGTRKHAKQIYQHLEEIQLLSGVVTVDHAPSSVLNVMSACTPDMFSITEML